MKIDILSPLRGQQEIDNANPVYCPAVGCAYGPCIIGYLARNETTPESITVQEKYEAGIPAGCPYKSTQEGGE